MLRSIAVKNPKEYGNKTFSTTIKKYNEDVIEQEKIKLHHLNCDRGVTSLQCVLVLKRNEYFDIESQRIEKLRNDEELSIYKKRGNRARKAVWKIKMIN